MQKYIPLHVHSEYSILDGACKIGDLVSKAKDMEFKYCSITDHGNCDGAIRFYNKCIEKEIKPIIGCELYVVKDRNNKEDKNEYRLHCTYLSKTEKGFHNLLKMLTIANLEGFYRRPRIDPKVLEENFSGEEAILFSGCSSGLLNEKWGRNLIKSLNYSWDDECVFVELMPFNHKQTLRYFEKAYDFASKNDLKCVITNDVHYLEKKDWQFHEAVLAIGSHPFRKFKDPQRWKFDKEFRGELCLKTYKEILESCDNSLSKFMRNKEIKKALENTLLIGEMGKDFKITTQQVELPKVIEREDTSEYLKETCWKRLEELELNKKKYRKRLEYELERIITLGFSEMMILVSDYVVWAKDNGIMVGIGRGSVGGSLVAYLLRITEVDPIRFDLLFDRFVSEGRIDLPDIDMDFEDKKRYMVEDYLRKKYGENNCAHVSTFLTYKGRQSLRDASRYMDVPYLEADKVAKSILKRSGGDMRSEFTCKDTFDTIEEAKIFKKKYPEASKIAFKLEGRSKTVGVHAAGFVVCKDELGKGNRCNLVRRKGKIVINWDKKDMEKMGLLKLDILGLRTLTILREAAELVKQRKGIDIDYYKLDVEGEGSDKVYNEFNKGNTLGVFQFTTKGVQKMTTEVGVDCFKDIQDINALYRPGALRCLSGDTKVCVPLKSDNSKIKKISMRELYKVWGVFLDNDKDRISKQLYDYSKIYICNTELIRDHNTSNFTSDKLRLKLASIRGIYGTGLKALYEVKCKGRRESIKATLSHRFMTDDGWKRLENISVRERLLMKNNLNIILGFDYYEVESIKFIGNEYAYDIEVDDKEHNYIANQFVVHNSGLANDYIARKKGHSEIPEVCDIYDEITKDTYGIILYQEQIMSLLYNLAGMPWQTVDTIRKVVSKSEGSEKFLKWKSDFVKGCKKKGTLDPDTAGKLYERLKDSGAYCLSGDTLVYRRISNQYVSREITVRDLYGFKFSGDKGERSHFYKFIKGSKKGISHGLELLSMSGDGFIRSNRVIDIIYTGNKVVYEVKTESGKSIKTTKDHKFYTSNGWKRLKDVNLDNDLVACSDFVIYKPFKGKGTGSGAHNEWHGGFLERKKLIESKILKVCSVCNSTRNVELHHRNGNVYNNHWSNIRWLCRRCHKKEHLKKDPECLNSFKNGYIVNFEKIVSIKKLGIEDTYDLEMEKEPRNFVANGFVVHNSFNKSHSTSYSIISWHCMYMKTFHPIEYMTALINNTHKEDYLNLFIKEAMRLGIKIKPPDSRYSSDKWEIASDNEIVAPLTMVRGVGEKAVKKFIEFREKNKFKESKIKDYLSKLVQAGKTVICNLMKIGAFDWLNINVEYFCSNWNEIFKNKNKILDKIDKYVIKGDFELGGFVKDVRETNIVDLMSFEVFSGGITKVRTMKERLSTSLDIKNIKDVLKDKKIDSDEYFYVFGKIDEIRFSYKESVIKWSEEKRDSLGGVYGFINDGTDFCMIIFKPELYKEKKRLIENLTGQYILAEVHLNKKVNGFSCKELWIFDELENPEEIALDLRKKTLTIKDINGKDDWNINYRKRIKRCEGCEVGKLASQAVPIESGEYNIMIVAESPGFEEDREGRPLVGKSGNKVFTLLGKEGLKRKNFWISNVFKCRPPNNKLENYDRHINRCKGWLDEEIRTVKPYLILSLGKYAKEFFSKKKDGIMKMNSTIEWNGEYGCWIVYSVHPAFALYNPENEKYLIKAIKKFSELAKNLGTSGEEWR